MYAFANDQGRGTKLRLHRFPTPYPYLQGRRLGISIPHGRHHLARSPQTHRYRVFKGRIFCIGPDQSRFMPSAKYPPRNRLKSAPSGASYSSCGHPHDVSDMPKHFSGGLTEYVLNTHTTISPPYHVTPHEGLTPPEHLETETIPDTSTSENEAVVSL